MRRWLLLSCAGVAAAHTAYVHLGVGRSRQEGQCGWTGVVYWPQAEVGSLGAVWAGGASCLVESAPGTTVTMQNASHAAVPFQALCPVPAATVNVSMVLHPAAAPSVHYSAETECVRVAPTVGLAVSASVVQWPPSAADATPPLTTAVAWGDTFAFRFLLASPREALEHALRPFTVAVVAVPPAAASSLLGSLDAGSAPTPGWCGLGSAGSPVLAAAVWADPEVSATTDMEQFIVTLNTTNALDRLQRDVTTLPWVGDGTGGFYVPLRHTWGVFAWGEVALLCCVAASAAVPALPPTDGYSPLYSTWRAASQDSDGGVRTLTLGGRRVFQPSAPLSTGGVRCDGAHNTSAAPPDAGCTQFPLSQRWAGPARRAERPVTTWSSASVLTSQR